MKNYHKIGESFNYTFKNGVNVRLVARLSDTIYDKQFEEYFRKSCEGCYFCRSKQSYCCGHPIWDTFCLLGGCKSALCSPEFREDGNFIHYKRILLVK